MKNARITLIGIFCLSVLGWGAAQECPSLQHASTTDLVAYLNGILPTDGNAECITVAIQRLAPQRFEPAVPGLVKLLDFRRPPTEDEKVHFLRRPQIPEELYPAAGALEEIGKKALPSVLEVIKFPPSAKARENAVTVWMQIYKYESAKGVESLRHEALQSEDPAIKDNLKWALSKAPTRCSPKDKTQCEAAATMPKR